MKYDSQLDLILWHCESILHYVKTTYDVLICLSIIQYDNDKSRHFIVREMPVI